MKKTTKTVMLVTVLKAKGKNAMDSLNSHAREAGCAFNEGGDGGPIYRLDCPAPNKDGTGTAMMMVYAGDRDGKPNSIVVWHFRCTQKKEEDCLKDWEEIWDIASDQPPEK